MWRITALLSSSLSPVTCQCSPSVIILELGWEHLNQQQPGAASKRYKYFSDLLNIFTAAGPSPGPGLVSAARRGGRGSEVIKFDHPTIKHLLFKLRGSTAAQRRPPCALFSTKLENEHWPRLLSTSWLFAAVCCYDLHTSAFQNPDVGDRQNINAISRFWFIAF